MVPDDVDLFLRRIQSLPERPMRTAALRTAFSNQEPERLVELFGVIIERCLLGVAPGEDCVLAFIPLLVDIHASRDKLLVRRRNLETLAEETGREPTEASLRAIDPDGQLRLWDALRAIYDLAADGASAEDEGDALRMRLVWRFLSEPRAHKSPPEKAVRFGPKWDRDVTLGDRRAMASRGNRQYLERLLYDRDSVVIRKLCGNPRLVEADILFIVSRRPNDPLVLQEVALSQWMSRYAVRHALAQNPYSSTGLILRLLPLLHEPDLKAFCHVGEMHPLVRDAATDLRDHRRALVRGPKKLAQ